MGLHFKKPGRAPAPAEDEETQEEFEERVYTALMRIARGSSAKLRSALGSCVMMGTRYSEAPENVREAVAAFIDEADL